MPGSDQCAATASQAHFWQQQAPVGTQRMAQIDPGFSPVHEIGPRIVFSARSFTPSYPV